MFCCRFYFFLITLLLSQNALFAQQPDVKEREEPVCCSESVEYFPGRLNIQPFRAHFLEPRLGFAWGVKDNNIRLDIGSSMDVLHVPVGTNGTLSFGGDFFTFTKLRGENEFHFPVDAVDYLFGVNTGLRFDEGTSSYGVRLRLSHISAHMVDGHFDTGTKAWRNGRKPIVYSREFLECMPFYSFRSTRIYAGVTYLFHVVPKDISKGLYNFGFDHYLTYASFGQFTPFAAYDWQLGNGNKPSPSHTITAGLRFGASDDKGVSLAFNYFNGNSVHGEYYDIHEDYYSVSLFLEL